MAYRPYTNLAHRLVSNTHEPDNDQACWLWTRHTDRWGYGRLNIYVDGANVKVQAHVALWVWLEAAPESIEEFWTAYLMVTTSRLQLDHCCVNPTCINPGHLELVTHAENMKRRDERRNEC